MVKLTVLYGHPEDPAAFEKYYAETHLPIAAKMPNVSKVETTKMTMSPEGNPPFYRMAEIYFESMEVMAATMGTPEAQATLADIPNFASGGVSSMIGNVGE